jgi:hypothetical protein
MTQIDIIHTTKEGRKRPKEPTEGKGQRHLIKIWERTQILEVTGISHSARRFPTQKIHCITYLAFRTNMQAFPSTNPETRS